MSKMKDNRQHVDDKPEKIMENKEKFAIKSINSTVFDCFKELTSDNEEERFNAAEKLLQYMSINYDNKKEKRTEELNYILKRLVRGNGASTITSRAGFFTTLVALLKVFKSENVNEMKILDLAKKELHVGGTVSNKEDADAIVGQILTCGALLRSGRLYEGAKGEEITRVVEILLSSSKYRSYHNSLAYSFLTDLLQNVDENHFINFIWPQLETEIKIPWNKQTLNTIYCTIIIINKFPNVITKKYLKTNFGGHQLLNSESFKYLFKIFFENPSMEIIIHPSYEAFGKYIAHHCKHLEEFWINTVEESLNAPSKLREISILKLITDILENADPNKLKISKLLSKNFIKMMVATLKGMKLKKDEILRAFYDEFFNALNKFSIQIQDDIEKVELIHKLILYPGIFCIEKYSSNRIIHQIINNLGEIGIKTIFETYKNIFLNKLPKNPNNTEELWMNVERQNAGYLLHTLICHKNIQNEFEWRAEQLKFMMTFGFFYVNEKGQIVKEIKEQSSYILAKDLASQLKDIFYTSLQSKLSRLKNEKNILLSLIEVCNGVLQRENYNKYFRNRINENILKIWNEMYTEVHKDKSKKEGLQGTLRLVFHILLLHMGLQLFREPEMAEAAILDLEQCMEKAKQKHKIRHKRKENDIEEEPEWIEVVIDLFLHLLSQNNNVLRNVVNSVFPHLCNNLTLTGIHQILNVLDMKDENNPLSEDDVENQDINHSDEDDENDKEKMDLSKETDDLNENENDTDDDDDDDDDNDDDDDESLKDDDDDEEIIEEEEEEEGTVTDKIRNAVTMALGSVGKDDDQESIDLDDMNEEEGKRLDEALSQAFKLIKRPNQSKKSKEYRIKATTLMHFRIRVLDLIEIYIQHNPSLLICMEIMLALYDMIEFCGDNKLQPLLVKIEKVLLKLTALRQFCNTDDVTEQNISDFLRLIIEKKGRPSVLDVFNKHKAKCCVFLIASEKLLDNKQSTIKLLTVFEEYINDFIKLRNPTINMTLLCDIFKMRWQGVWHLSKIISENLSSDKIRVFRRIQIFELLDLLYKNYELIRQNLNDAENYLKIIESYIQKHIEFLTQKDKISIREFNSILDVLFIANRCHMKIPLQSNFNKEIICNNIQEIRKKVKLENVHSYNRFCNVFGLKNIKNFEILNQLNIVKINGIHETHNISEDNNENKKDKHLQNEMNIKEKQKIQKKNEINSNHIQDDKKKRKNTVTNDSRKQKKLKKEERLRKASEGFNGEMSFINIGNGNISNNEIFD